MAATEQTTQAQSTVIDSSKTEAFVGKVVGDMSGTFATILAALGDRLGLFKDLAAHGAQTSEELAGCLKLSERYVREWASCLTSAGYLAFDPATKKFSIPPENVPALAQEGGPYFFMGFHQQIGGLLQNYDPVSKCFKEGGGVPRERFHPDVWVGEKRSNDIWHENLLVQQWVPLAPTVEAMLKAGARVADIGCGSGTALVRLAQAFPKSTFVGFDIHAPSIEAARAFANREGVADRVKFEARDLTNGLPGPFGIITAFDVVHDLADPFGAFRAVRKALAPGGRFFLLEINTSHKLEENAGPLGTIFYGVSVLYCMTISLEAGGLGLGTAGLPEARVREAAAQAGFSAVNRIEINNPLNCLYEVVA